MEEQEEAPLEQRQSSRKKRRAARQNATAAAPSTTTTTTIFVPPQQRRGPSDEIERRIAESVEKRKRSNAANAAISKDLVEADYNEILGTYEYLDHTADIQLHSWGDSLEVALEQLAMALFGYMTKLSMIEENDQDSVEYGTNIAAEAHDLTSLVFNFLQEWLCVFHETGFVPRTVTVQSLDHVKDFTVTSSGRGETMKPDKHIQGTEVKAVTYSNLQVIQSEDTGRWDIWVILDI